MSVKKKHVAASGVKEGQWVACTAQKCRNDSIHVDTNDLLFAQAYHTSLTGEHVPVSKVPVAVVAGYQALPDVKKDVIIREHLAVLRSKGSTIGGLDRKYYEDMSEREEFSDAESHEQSVADMSWLSEQEKQALTYFSTENFEWVNEALYTRKKLVSVPGSKADFGSGLIETDVVEVSAGETYVNPHVTAENQRTREVFKETIATLDGALVKTSRRQPRTVYRGVRGDINGMPAARWAQQHAQPGKKVSFLGYQSTSLNFDVASDIYADENESVIFNISTSEGLNISSISSYPEEQEVLLPRNRMYTVVSAERMVRGSGRSAVLVSLIADDELPEPAVDERGSWLKSFLRLHRK